MKQNKIHRRDHLHHLSKRFCCCFSSAATAAESSLDGAAASAKCQKLAVNTFSGKERVLSLSGWGQKRDPEIWILGSERGRFLAVYVLLKLSHLNILN